MRFRYALTSYWNDFRFLVLGGKGKIPCLMAGRGSFFFFKRSYSPQGASIDLITVGNYISCGDKCSQGIAPLNDNKNESRMTLGYKMTTSGLENEFVQACPYFCKKKKGHPPWQVLEMHTAG